MNSTIIIMFSVIIATVIVGLAPAFGKKAAKKQSSSTSEYFLGSRGLGVVLTFFTSMATWYSSSLFLGGVAEVYRGGVEWSFAFTSSALAGLVFFLVAPIIRRVAGNKNYVTQADFFSDKLHSSTLGYIVSIIGMVCIVPYITVQVVGTGIIFELFTDGMISFEVGAAVGVAVCALFIFYGGMRSVAWTDVFFGLVFVISIWSAVLLILNAAFGSERFFDVAAKRIPQLLTLTDANRPIGYYISQIWVIGLGGYMWPHLFLRMVSTKSPSDVRTVGTLISFASVLSQFPVVIGGFAAAILLPNLAAPDTGLLLLVKEYTPMWMVGVLGAGGIAASLSTVNALAHCQGVLIAKDVYKRLKKNPTERQIVTVSRMFILLTCLIAYVFALTKPSFLWSILANTYAGIVQIFPITIAALFWKRTTAKGCIAALIVGVAVALLYNYVLVAPYGIVAPAMGLMANVVVLIVVSLCTKPNENPSRSNVAEA